MHNTVRFLLILIAAMVTSSSILAQGEVRTLRPFDYEPAGFDGETGTTWIVSSGVNITTSISCSTRPKERLLELQGEQRVYCENLLVFTAKQIPGRTPSLTIEGEDLRVSVRMLASFQSAGRVLQGGTADERAAFDALLAMDRPIVSIGEQQYLLSHFRERAERDLANNSKIARAFIMQGQQEDKNLLLYALALAFLSLVALIFVIPWAMRQMHNTGRKSGKQLKTANQESHSHTAIETSDPREASLKKQIQLAMDSNDLETAKLLMSELDRLQSNK